MMMTYSYPDLENTKVKEIVKTWCKTNNWHRPFFNDFAWHGYPNKSTTPEVIPFTGVGVLLVGLLDSSYAGMQTAITDHLGHDRETTWVEDVKFRQKLREAEANAMSASTALHSLKKWALLSAKQELFQQPDKLTHLYRGRSYSGEHLYQMYYEPCPIIGITKKRIICESKDLDTPYRFYPGGIFQVDKEQLLNQGYAYHSRHGENFYVCPLPDNKEPIVAG